MTEANGKHCHFVSDLHLLASRSYGDGLFEPIRKAAALSSDFVLGGDIFDFRWSTLGSSRESVEVASRWLRGLVEEFPDCRFHYVLGNHDYHGAFLDNLDHLSGEVSNFEWDPFCIRIQNAVFLHGDAADGHENALILKRSREKNLDEEPKHPRWHRAYDAIVRTGIHKPAPWIVHPHRRVVRRLMTWLEAEGHGPAAGVKSVYFGHTHHPMELEYRGVWFHNGGGAIRGQKCQILRVQHRGESSS
jgi:UDP-2,3-diacylglucosamine pyrophosphatase LpxH